MAAQLQSVCAKDLLAVIPHLLADVAVQCNHGTQRPHQPVAFYVPQARFDTGIDTKTKAVNMGTIISISVILHVQQALSPGAGQPSFIPVNPFSGCSGVEQQDVATLSFESICMSLPGNYNSSSLHLGI